MISPRENFKRSPHAKNWQGFMGGAQFQAGAEAAMAQMLADTYLRGNTTPEDAQALAWRLLGARDFLAVLTTLTETHDIKRSTVKQNLDHGA